MIHHSNTTVRTVARHLVSVFKDHGAKQFEHEFQIVLDCVRDRNDENRQEELRYLCNVSRQVIRELLGSKTVQVSIFESALQKLSMVPANEFACQKVRMLVLKAVSLPENELSTNLALSVYQYVKGIQIKELQQLNVETLADRFDVSRSYLSRSFRRVFGRKLSDFLVSERLNRAHKLLSCPDAKSTVVDVAKEVGFSQVQYFRKRFKECFGYSPGRLTQLRRACDGD